MDYRTELSKLIKIEGVNEQEIYEGVVPAKDTELADYAFACFKYAKALRKAPQIIACEIVDAIDKPEFLQSVEAVNGYVNFKLSKTIYVKQVCEKVFAKGGNYGTGIEGKGKTICIDYSSVNIAKPFHMGHLYATTIGAALYRIYKRLGYNVVGINHLGDWGTQFGKLITAYKMWGDKEDIDNRGLRGLLDIYVKFHKEAEKDESLNEVARGWFKKIEDSDEEALALFKWFKDITLGEVKKVYRRLNVHFDSYNGESFYNDKMEPVIAELQEKGLTKISDGATIVEFPDGDMPPCLIKRSDGATLYATRDMAAAFYRKKTYDFYKCLYVVAYQQNLHFKQLFKVIEMMGYDWSKDMVHVPFGMVSIEGGKLSTRDGHVIFAEEVLDTAKAKALEVIMAKNADLKDKDEIAESVGVGAVVFGMLSSGRIKDLVFSYDKVLNFDGETGPYVQYTYARCCSLLTKSADIEGEVDYTTLTTKEAYELIKLIDKYPEAIAEAGRKYEPCVLTRYILSIAAQFNRFYLEQNISNSPKPVRNARLMAVSMVKDIIGGGMALLGIQCPEKM